MQVDMFRLIGADSEPIGVYEDESQQYFLTLTKSDCFLYNKRAKKLTRKCGLDQGAEILRIDETVDYLLHKNESFKLQMKHHFGVLDFQAFERIFKRKNVLMGLGSHKALDYLNLSINLPLSFHPNSIFSRKYTKTTRDLITRKVEIQDYNKNPQVKLDVMRAINEAYFKEALMFKSDINQAIF